MAPQLAGLPDFPWDTLAAAKAAASAHPGGLVDLSVGTPVDPTPQLGIDALVGGGEQPGLPADLRHRRRCGRRWPAI